MSSDHRNHGADHVELGADIETYACATAVIAEDVSTAEAAPPTGRADVVSSAWAQVVDAQAELLASLERRCRAGVPFGALASDAAKMLGLVQAMDTAAVPDGEAEALYARERLHRYWLQCPYVARAFAKPLGYAGDYLLMDWMYDADCRADTRLGELLCKVYLSFPVVQAGVSRIDWLQRRIAQVVDSLPGVPRIASLACGPAAEVAGVLATCDRPLEVVLLDQDRDALAHCGQRFAHQAAQGGMHPQSSVSLCNVAVRQILKDTDAVLASVGLFDLLWAVGLFDYLPAPVATSLVERLRRFLKPGGRLIIGNFAPHDCMAIMDSVADWRLQYRTPEQLAALGPADARVAAEPVGLMWFLEVGG